MLNVSSVADVFLGISQKYPEQLFKKKTLKDVPYFIKENLRMSASDEATLKKIFCGSKPSLKLTSKTKWYHSWHCCNDSRSCEQLKKCVTGKYFEKKKIL